MHMTNDNKGKMHTMLEAWMMNTKGSWQEPLFEKINLKMIETQDQKQSQ